MASEPSESSSAGSPLWRVPISMAPVAALVACLLVWLFWDGLGYMWNAWVSEPEYSHAMLIPFIAAFLVWQRKNQLERLPFEGSRWGILLVLLGGLLLALGQLATIYALTQYAFLLTLLGLALAYLGTRAFRLVALPLLMLALMIPLPAFVNNNLSLKLQLLSSDIGVHLMRLFSVSVFLQGNVIDLGNYQLQVAEACSGLRYLFPLMTFGFLVAYFYKGAHWKRITLFLSSIPLAVLMNSLRVGVIGITVDHWGIGMAEGMLHEFQGWTLFMFCLVILFAEMMLLNSIGTKAGSWRKQFGIDFPSPSPADALRLPRKLPGTFLATLVLLMVIAAVSALLPRPTEVIPVRSAFALFPLQLEEWQGKREALDEVYLEQLKLDDYFMANYRRDDGQFANLYMAWYDSQRKGEAVHSPRSCLPGGGWEMKQFGQRTIPQAAVSGQPLRVNRALIQLGDQREIVYYWFQQRGRIIDDEFMVKWYIFLDSLVRHRTDGALVRIIMPVPEGANEAAIDHEMEQFAARVAPLVPRFVPN